MYCTKCGVVLEGSHPFCSQCGTPTEGPDASSGNNPTRRLTRSITDAKIAGICGGLAKYLAADATFVRLIWLVATICFPPLLLGYIAAWIIVPKESPRATLRVEAGIPQAQS